MYLSGFSESELLRATDNNKIRLEKNLNLDFNPRDIIGDNTNDINDTHYGNPDVIGPNSGNGTSAAVIIAGVRNNELGIDGIATDVEIMSLRAIPKGDERDKDVALAINYAVNNGADIICMNFGKKISPQREFVDDAIKYAELKNVLIVRSAGDNAENLDQEVNFPTGIYPDKSKATNFICVGASRKNKGDSMVYVYSNYGQNYVDIFAPGAGIYSTDLNNEYSSHSGSGPAANVVAGIAALILSYHPELKPNELIDILLASSTDYKKRLVLKPSLNIWERETVKFETLCKSGGIINAYEAMKMADAGKVK